MNATVINLAATPDLTPASSAAAWAVQNDDLSPAQLAQVIAAGRAYLTGLRESLERRAPEGRPLSAGARQLKLVEMLMERLVDTFEQGDVYESDEERDDVAAYVAQRDAEYAENPLLAVTQDQLDAIKDERWVAGWKTGRAEVGLATG